LGGDLCASFATVEEERDGTVVGNVDEHVSAELARGDGDAGGGNGLDQFVEEPSAIFGAGGGVERWAAAVAGGAGNGEVADQQDGAAGLFDVEIEVLLAACAAEDAQGDELLCGPLDIGGRVIAVYGGEDGQAGADLADEFATDRYGGVHHTLHYANHRIVLLEVQCGVY